MRINSTGEVLTVYLQGEIDHHTARDMREGIDKAISFYMPSLLILDFAEISFMDSSGIGLVMGRYKLMKNLSGRIMIENAPKNIKKVMRMAGIEKLLFEESRKEFAVK